MRVAVAQAYELPRRRRSHGLIDVAPLRIDDLVQPTAGCDNQQQRSDDENEPAP
jgi:hypothetical protein